MPGPMGASGPTGPTGPTGPGFATAYMSGMNEGGVTFEYTIAGTPIALPLNQLLLAFTADAGNELFTLTGESGVYLFSYTVYISSTSIPQIGIFRNGTLIPNSITIMSSTTPVVTKSSITTLNTGDTVALTLLGANSTIQFTAGSGAIMNASRIG